MQRLVSESQNRFFGISYFVRLQKAVCAVGMAAVPMLTQTACPNPPDLETEAVLGVKDYVQGQLDVLADAAAALQAVAPEPDADGWDEATRAAAIPAMQAEWQRARLAYERIEGAIAVLFPDLDASTDARYDDFIAEGADNNLFDGEGVTGVHGIERILWSDEHPDDVIAFESGLPGYVAAAFPSNEQEASDFKNGLAKRLVDDCATMKTAFASLALDAPTAYNGVLASMLEQLEKLNLAQTGEDESRYARNTLADMRANLEGGKEIFAKFAPFVVESAKAKGQDGDALIANVDAAFARISTAYNNIDGNAIPAVPATWNPDAPSEADAQTPYGQLFQLLLDETNPENTTSLLSLMTEAATAADIPVE